MIKCTSCGSFISGEAATTATASGGLCVTCAHDASQEYRIGTLVEKNELLEEENNKLKEALKRLPDAPNDAACSAFLKEWRGDRDNFSKAEVITLLRISWGAGSMSSSRHAALQDVQRVLDSPS